jgi:hypothetical protein
VISASIRPPNAITDFLYRALAGGALGVEELEIKARATGLLGERQQIQHAKAFKKAKKALGIRSIRAGFGSSGKWAWLMPPQTATEIDRVANAHLDTNEQTSLSDAELSGQRVVASESRSIVHEWIEGVQRLDYVRSPTAIPLIPLAPISGRLPQLPELTRKLGRTCRCARLECSSPIRVLPYPSSRAPRKCRPAVGRQWWHARRTTSGLGRRRAAAGQIAARPPP